MYLYLYLSLSIKWFDQKNAQKNLAIDNVWVAFFSWGDGGGGGTVL